MKSFDCNFQYNVPITGPTMEKENKSVSCFNHQTINEFCFSEQPCGNGTFTVENTCKDILRFLGFLVE